MASLKFLSVTATKVDKVTPQAGTRKLLIPTHTIYKSDYATPSAELSNLTLAPFGLNNFNFQKLEGVSLLDIITGEAGGGSELPLYEFLVSRENMRVCSPLEEKLLNLEHNIYFEEIDSKVIGYFKGFNSTADVDYDVYELWFPLEQDSTEPAEDQWAALISYIETGAFPEPEEPEI